MMSRLLDDVATLFSLQADVAIASNSVLMSRPLPDVATSIFSQLYILCRDFDMVSRPHCPPYWVQFCPDLLVLPSITLLLRLEFLGRELDMNFHCCQGFTTSGPLILVRLSCCNFLQPVISVMLSHLLLLLLQKFLFLLNSLLHTSLVSYSIFLHINQSF